MGNKLNNKLILAVIPARGGSKGVPKKNIAPINNKPLISFTIEAAIQSEAFSDIIVSTDDLDIKKVAENHGASVPFIRPANLATDNALAIPTIQHSVKFMEDKKKCFL